MSVVYELQLPLQLGDSNPTGHVQLSGVRHVPPFWQDVDPKQTAK